MPISPGDTVGPYRIIEPLGQGGMATVYKAYHPALDRYVAIKVLHPAFKEDVNFSERFRREARIVARLDHPNIIPIYDFAEHAGMPYLVMRYVEGKTLKAVLRETTGMLPTARILAIVYPITQALNYAHAQGILHRDIKPSNVMRANDGHIYLADFGLARIAQAGDSTISKDTLIGTPQYISPEQARGEPATERSDIYSLGVLLFEMFTGRVPFNADTPYAIIHDHIYTALPLPTTLNSSLSQEIERVLLKALAKEPAARYASAGEVMSALETAAGISISTVATLTPPPIPLVPPTTVPEPLATPAATDAGGMWQTLQVKAASSVRPGSSARAVPPSSPSPARALNWKLWAVVGAFVIGLLLCGGAAFAFSQRATLARWFAPATPVRTRPAGIPPGDTVAQARAKVQANPNDANAHIELGDAYERQRNNDAAFNAYDTAIKLDPRNPRAYVQAGELAANLRDYERAQKYFAMGHMATPDDLELLLSEGDLFVVLKRYDDARANYERALQLRPNTAQALWRLGTVDRYQGRLPDAARNYARALAIDPNLPEAHFGMGMLALGRGEYDEARRQFQIVINNPNAPPEYKDQAQQQLNALPAK